MSDAALSGFLYGGLWGLAIGFVIWLGAYNLVRFQEDRGDLLTDIYNWAKRKINQLQQRGER